ncbi:MAG: HopJ type III effector protein [Gammaproteobacteria bacterium]|nr:HopJ type III effector protein [Gammaproteobacteria bacterium]
MSTLKSLLQKIDSTPDSIEFSDVINIIDQNYSYIPTSFTNGSGDNMLVNNAGDNEGSCKIFSFAKLHQLTEEQTLNCFGAYFRLDVLAHPDNADHANIRTFIRYGWDGISFDRPALTIKSD